MVRHTREKLLGLFEHLRFRGVSLMTRKHGLPESSKRRVLPSSRLITGGSAGSIRSSFGENPQSTFHGNIASIKKHSRAFCQREQNCAAL
jgi:hypothetical protein